MFVLVENDSITKTLSTSRGITIGENQYPRAIYTLWSAAEREAIGIYEVVHDNSNKKDEKYYNNTNQSFNFADGKVTASLELQQQENWKIPLMKMTVLLKD